MLDRNREGVCSCHSTTMGGFPVSWLVDAIDWVWIVWHFVSGIKQWLITRIFHRRRQLMISKKLLVSHTVPTRSTPDLPNTKKDLTESTGTPLKVFSFCIVQVLVKSTWGPCDSLVIFSASSERKSCEDQLMPFTTLLIDCLWIGMDYLTFCLKGCGLILPQLRWFFMFEGRNAKKATKLNCKLPSMGTKL